ncbi:MAG: hypothetical protein H0U95_09500 [Bacteroidetes bacterium]|nr:hypothetical protein [Bacteroidota bacterium]
MGKINLHNYEAFLIDYLDGNLNETAIAELKAFILANPQLQLDLNDLDLPSFTEEVIPVDFKNELKKNAPFVEDEELINYLEGNLSEVERKVFELKLLNNKELASEFESYKKAILNAEKIIFDQKAALYKVEEDLVLSNTVLAYVEGELTTAEKLLFEKELKTNFFLQKELSAFQRTKLAVDASIVFPDKEALKKETKVIALFSFRTVASFAAAILLLIGFAFIFNYYNSTPTIAKQIANNNFKMTLNNTEYQIVKSGDATHKLNKDLPLDLNMIANNSKNVVKSNSIKKDAFIDLNEPKTNSVAVNKQEENKLELNNEPNEIKNGITNNNTVIDTTHVAIANNSQPKYSKQTYLLTEEPDADDQPLVNAPQKKGFWQRAVKIAKQANRLGVKAIDGEETLGKNYSLSFNAFSVEKK